MADSARTGRPIETRLRARGWLRLRTPLHVGGANHDPNADLDIAVDGRGRAYVPGTSLAGAFRSWSEGSSEDGAELRDLWGYVEENGPGGTASRVVIRDALVTADTALSADELPASPIDLGRLEVRTGVGIDRVTGAAAPGILYGRIVIPAGAFLRLELDVESSRQELTADRARLGELLSALTEEKIRLGAATTRGLGMVGLMPDSLLIEEDHLDSKAGLLALLTQDGSRTRTLASLRGTAPAGLPPRRDLLVAEISWRPATPVMVRSAVDGIAVPVIPLTTAVDADQVTMVLPGSGIKGALRSRADWIERSVRGLDPAPPQGDDVPAVAAAFRAQLDQLPAVSALFGAAPKARPRRAGSEPDADGRGKGAVTVDDCFAMTPIAAELWRAVYEPPDVAQGGDGGRGAFSAELRDQLEESGLTQADHVAIDRWTAGAADGRLYSVLEPHAVDWDPIRITIDLTRLDRAPGVTADAGLALMLLVLRDLAENRIYLGYGTNRGMGDIEVVQVRLAGTGRTDGPDLASLLASDEAERLTAQWLSYVDGSGQ
jgi:CRISPR/Cas system CSM-associated protein Csm3 (group 7 of RAMP superfamily)